MNKSPLESTRLIGIQWNCGARSTSAECRQAHFQKLKNLLFRNNSHKPFKKLGGKNMKNILRFIGNGKLRFELMTRFCHSQITLLFCSFMLMILFCVLLINGCNKESNSDPSDDPILDENQAIHAAAVAGYQALGAGTSYPFKALQLSCPTGSAIRNLSSAKSILHSLSLLKSTTFNHNSSLSDPIEYSENLNLYTSNSITGNVQTVNYYSDAAGTKSAGSATLTLATNITNISDPTSYASYPVNITLVVNITAGNLPCKGNISIIFTGGTGANTMTGTLTLTKVDVEYSINLALDNQMNTTGSVTITESGATIEITNVKGKVRALACDMKISPYGWTGTGTLDLMTGAMTANINTGTGTSTVTSDSLGNLNINYADGTHEIVIHALSAGLTGTSNANIATSITATSGTPQSATFNTAFASPLNVLVKDQNGNPMSNETVIFSAPSTGQSCTFTGGVTTITATTNAQGQAQVSIIANATGGDYNVTASVAGVATSATFSLTNIGGSSNPVYNAPLIYSYNERTIVTINNNGQSIGYLPGTSYKVPVYWPTPTSQPQTLQISAGETASAVNGLNDYGQIVGNGYYYNIIADKIPTNPIYWSSPTAQPQKLAVPENTVYAVAMSINNSGQIVGYSDNFLLYWASPTDTPIVLQTLASGYYSGGQATFIAPNGQIIGKVYNSSGILVTAVWASPTQPPVVLKALTGDVYSTPMSINSAGLIVGASGDLISTSTYVNGSHAVTWAGVNASAIALPLLSGLSGRSVYIAAASINTAGVIVGGPSENVNDYGVIWENGQVQDLNTLIPPGNSQTLGAATLITDQGWILGTIGGGDIFAFPTSATQYLLIPK
jgi:hypothetical protein